MSLTFNYPPNGLAVESLDRRDGGRGGEEEREKRERDWSTEKEGSRSFKLCLFMIETSKRSQSEVQ